MILSDNEFQVQSIYKSVIVQEYIFVKKRWQSLFSLFLDLSVMFIVLVFTSGLVQKTLVLSPSELKKVF